MTTPTNPTPEALAAAKELCQLAHRELYRDRFIPSTGVHQLKAHKTIETIENHYAGIVDRIYATILAERDQLREKLERITDEQATALQIVDALTYGFDRALSRVLAGDEQGALRELKLAMSRADSPTLNGRTLKAAMAKAELAVDLADALESAKNGLDWYRGEHPQDESPADDEMAESIANVLARYAALTQPTAGKSEDNL